MNVSLAVGFPGFLVFHSSGKRGAGSFFFFFFSQLPHPSLLNNIETLNVCMTWVDHPTEMHQT